MIKKIYSRFQETVYTHTMPSGLTVHLLPKEGYVKTYALLVVRFGGEVQTYKQSGDNDWTTIPLGVAHFLEHKMFETETGTDISSEFLKLGADVNAYTDYDQTAYLTVSTSNTEEVISMLMNFVRHPHFSDDDVEKEKTIIEQERKMYLDKSSSRLQLGLMKNMYSKNPVREEILGTKTSIQAITKDILNQCHRTFYHPSNMFLIVAGDMNPDLFIEFIEKIDQQITPSVFSPIEFLPIIEPPTVYHRSKTIQMDIAMPKVAVGIKLPVPEPHLLVKNDILYRIILEHLFGFASLAYQQLLDLELINTGFSYSGELSKTYAYIRISANTRKVEEFILFIQDQLLSVTSIIITQTDLDLMKKAFLGGFIKALNYIDVIVNGYADFLLEGEVLFDYVQMVESITLEDLNSVRHHFTKDAFSEFIILPKKVI